MISLLNYPGLVLILTFVALSLSVRLGASIHSRWKSAEGQREDFGLILTATLTLLGLIIGFTFSVAISRYDQRKNYEEAEANAIGTEYLRAGLLPTGDAAKARTLLKSYLAERILFYQTRDAEQRQKVNVATGQLEDDLWSTVQAPAEAQPNGVIALAVSGMNDVLNSQGYTQAAWWYRIPIEAWGLMAAIAVCCNLLIGYGAHRTNAKGLLFLVIPLLVAISFYLIADIDSPRGGIIRVQPQNLTSLSQSLNSQ